MDERQQHEMRLELLRRLAERGAETGPDDGQIDTALQMAADPNMRVLPAQAPGDSIGVRGAIDALRQSREAEERRPVDVAMGEPEIVDRKRGPAKGVDVSMGEPQMQPRPPSVDVQIGMPDGLVRMNEEDEPTRWSQMLAALGLDG